MPDDGFGTQPFGAGFWGSGEGAVAPPPLPPELQPVYPPLGYAAQTEPDYGQDIEALTDITPMLTLVRGRRNLALAVARRLLTQPGYIRDVTGDQAPDAASYGWDVRSRLNRADKLRDLQAIDVQLTDQVSQDPRVSDADVTTQFDLATSTLTIEIELDTDQGPFTLVIVVGQLSVKILDGQGDTLITAVHTGGGTAPALESFVVTLAGLVAEEVGEPGATQTVVPPPDFGVDIEALDDIAPSLVLVSGERNLLLALARRFITQAGMLRDVTGDLADGAGDYGLDMRARLNRPQKRRHIEGLGRLIEAQCQLDPRVREATASTAFDLATSKLTVDIRVETTEGPFALVLVVSALSVAILDGAGEIIAESNVLLPT